ncbi:MAG: hypothetical protein ACYCY2_02270 [Acidithiobacillus ferriphilus]
MLITEIRKPPSGEDPTLQLWIDGHWIADIREKAYSGSAALILSAMNALADVERMRETFEGILSANWRKWEELASPEEFVRWAEARALHALAHGREGDE